MNKYIFTLALLQMVAQAQQQAPETVAPPPGDDAIIPDEDNYEMDDDSLADLLEDQYSHARYQYPRGSPTYPRHYFRGDAYQGQDADQKLAQLWEMLVPDEAVVEEPTPFFWTGFDDFFQNNAAGPFCNKMDEMRKTRNKTTHTQGIVAKIEWRPIVNTLADENFSGIYEHGSQHAILRMSSTKNLTSSSNGILPAIAIKFLISGKESTNLFAMPNFTGKVNELGEESWDFFHQPLGNRVQRFEDDTEDCERAALETKMLQANPFPYATSVVFPAVHDTSDYLDPQVIWPKTDSRFNAPYGLEYESTTHLTNDNLVPWYDRVKNEWNDSIDTGIEKPFIDVYAWTAPESLDGKRVKIAEIVLKSKLHTSVTGDQRLFFQHKRIKHDRKYWPREWKNVDFQAPRDRETTFAGIDNWSYTSEEDAEQAYLTSLTSGTGCPFQWLFQ